MMREMPLWDRWGELAVLVRQEWHMVTVLNLRLAHDNVGIELEGYEYAMIVQNVWVDCEQADDNYERYVGIWIRRLGKECSQGQATQFASLGW